MFGGAGFDLNFISVCDIMSIIFLGFAVFLFAVPLPIHIIAALNSQPLLKMVLLCVISVK
jgi:hypothetical protein